MELFPRINECLLPVFFTAYSSLLGPFVTVPSVSSLNKMKMSIVWV